ncbi:MAG TPA: monovalent cation/H(+) antiporter subunit G [Candidatus Limivicinus faecipullorum]|nr:monovalent cation/H(+) antiporter subunit G [Candidatus Limivicinus faecipullorum]
MLMLRIAIDVLIAIGVIFALAGTLGVMKMPDTFCRMQASTCVTTLGVIGVGLGALLYTIFIMGSAATAVKVLVICGLVLVTNPVGAHAIAKGAYQAGIRPKKKMEIEDYRRDFNE